MKDPDFVKSNEMFKAVCMESKKNGKGIKKSYPPISPDRSREDSRVLLS